MEWFLYILVIVWFGYWSAEAGASLPWSKKWQDKADWLSEAPEIIIALSVGNAAVYGWDLESYPLSLTLFVVGSFITYVGKQSATWAYLNWEGHKNPDTDRDSTLKGFNDFVAGLFGWKLGDEGYSWVWAGTKGLIMTVAVGGSGAIFHPIGHEVGSHAKGRLPGSPNMYKELSAGAIGIGIPCVILLLIGS